MAEEEAEDVRPGAAEVVAFVLGAEVVVVISS